MSRPRLSRWLVQNLTVAAVLVLFLLVWEEGVRIFAVKRYLLPAPSAIVRAMVQSRPFLIHHTMATIQTVLVGFGISLGFAVLLAICMLFSPAVARLMQPFIVVSQTLPTVITAPLLLIWVGFGPATKVIATVLNAFFPIVISLYDGLRSPERNQVEMLEAAGATRWQIFTKLRLPASMPMLFSGLKLASTSSVTGAMVGEWMVGRDGLGYYVQSMASQMETADVFAGVMLVSLIGVVFYLIITILERVLMPWYFLSKEAGVGGQSE